MQNNLKIYAAIITTMLMWGLSYIATKIALESFSTYSLVLLRFFIASIIFAILLLMSGLPKFTKRDHLKIIATSAFFPFLYFFLETTALKYTTASEASLIAAIIPIVVLILSSMFLKEKIALKGIIGILFSFIGIVILVFGNMEQKLDLQQNLFGNLLMLGSVLSASFYMILTRNLGKKYSPLHITGTQIIYGTLLFFILCGIKYGELQITNLTMERIFALIFLSVFSTVLAFLCNNYALTKTSAAKVSVFINGVPVVTLFFAYLILHESLTPLQMVGGIIVIIALTITSVFGETKEKSKITSTKSHTFLAKENKSFF